MQLALQTDSVRAIAFELHPLQLVYNVPTLQRMRDAFAIIGANSTLPFSTPPPPPSPPYIENEDPYMEGERVRQAAAFIQPLLAAANVA